MQTFDRFYRSAVLGVAGNKVVQDIVRQRGGSLVSRFVAGEDLHQALAALDRLESEGVHGILDLLGESVTSEEQARAFTAQITEIVDALAAKPYPRYVSIKLTQLGLDLSTDLALENARAIVSRAAPSGTFVRIDMEDSPRIDRTLAIYRTLREGFDNVGIVLQAYLYRTEGDLEDLAELRPNVRIVKGAYLEPPELAYSDKAAVDAQFRRVFYRAVELGCHAAAATHDESIIRDVKYYAQQQG
ncbi:MAG TPA: proline dehydrogenase family protein, partial [Deinococcales bacterium]|nr:proline dehydrogenase family protein [Deinococcales bacterium]